MGKKLVQKKTKKIPLNIVAAPVAFPIVGIGASAGGLEAYTELFRLLPPDTGMAFVLVQHLSPSHLSMLSEIVQKSTRMTVHEVQDGTKIYPDNVYVIPPNAALEVLHGVLHLRPLKEPRSTNRLVDTFFRSLAFDHRNLAVGIVLSGTGSDGSQGLRDIKAEGGISLVQEPSSAKFDGMPMAAIQVDHPDVILPIKGLVAELIKVAGHPRVAKILAVEPSSLSPEDTRFLQRIFLAVRSATGTDFSNYKIPTVLRRIRRRMVLHKLESLKHYSAYLEDSSEEQKCLFNDLLINVTEFFRDPEAFEALKTEVLPEIFKERPDGEAIRVWVPGCSTGEEVYSIAIIILEYLGSRASKFPIQIYGTDVGEAVIKKARAGVFTDVITKQISEDRLERFFVKEHNGYKVSSRVRECCIFSTQDVTIDPPIHRLDILSCRNLMIYLSVNVQKQLMENFFYALRPSGFLLLGSSESVGTAASLFAIVDERAKIYVKRATALAPRRDRVKSQISAELQTDLRRKAGNKPGPKETLDPVSRAEKVVLENFAPAWILVNHVMDVVHFKGDTEKYIAHRSGQASWSLFKMLREDLIADTSVLLHACQKERKPERRENLKLVSGQEARRLAIEVYPLDAAGIDPHYIILFFEGPVVEPVSHQASTEDTRVVTLSEELATTQKSLRAFMEDQNATNEELQSANEEILSTNEELQSTNEELETAKEELQSTNEELVTLNEELSVRNDELSDTNADLSNVLNNSQNAIVIVSGSLKIRRLTPAAGRLLNIGVNDIGRSLMDFNLGFPMEHLEAKLKEVIQNVSTVELEERNRAGQFYSIRIKPFKTSDNRIDGAVATFVDIDELKRRQIHIESTQRYSNAIIQAIHDPLLVLDRNLRVMRTNRAFFRTFQTDENATLGKLFYELGNGQWNIPELRSLLEDILPQKLEIDNFKVTHDFLDIGVKTMFINARRLEWEVQKEVCILLAIREIGDRPSTKGTKRANS